MVTTDAVYLHLHSSDYTALSSSGLRAAHARVHVMHNSPQRPDDARPDESDRYEAVVAETRRLREDLAISMKGLRSTLDRFADAVRRFSGID